MPTFFMYLAVLLLSSSVASHPCAFSRLLTLIASGTLSNSLTNLERIIPNLLSMRPKDYLVVFFLLSLLPILSVAQSKEDKNIHLLEIRQKYQLINKATGYNVVIIEGSEDFLGHATDGGGNLRGYFKNDTLVKIVEWVGLSNRTVQNEYYLDKDGLFFVYSAEQQYPYNDSLQALDYSKLVPTFSSRYYFKNNKLIDTILSNKKLKQSITDDAAGFLKRVNEYAVLLNKKKK